MFTGRDLEQTADTSDADYIELTSGEDVYITEGGVYVISGSAENASIMIGVGDEAKVQLVLSGVSVINEATPVVYVSSADKVFITTADGTNHMEVTGAYEASGDTNLDAVVFSKDDLVLNGTGSLEIVSAKGNGITSKDDLKVTGGTLIITAALDGLEANDSIRICGGDLTITSSKDALHSEYDEDDSVGYVYIAGGTLHISAADDGIQGTSEVLIEGGTIDIESCTDGIKGTYIQIDDGDVSIYATDEGVNATTKSSAYSTMIMVNGGTIHVEVGSDDATAFDSKGDIYVNGGTIEVNATSAFEADGVAALNGGTVTVNGQIVTELV